MQTANVEAHDAAAAIGSPCAGVRTSVRTFGRVACDAQPCLTSHQSFRGGERRVRRLVMNATSSSSFGSPTAGS